MDLSGRVVEAAQELLGGLTPDQRERATWSFGDEERRRWFYTPTDHGGLSLAEMDSVQHQLVHKLLASVLSEPGYVTTAVILGQDNILDYHEGFRTRFGRPRGRDPMLFWVAVFGEPALEGAWGWRFGGHHISVQLTMIDGRITSTTPCFLGADPASMPLLGPHLHRPLGGAEDLGRELVHSLDSTQAASALVAPAPPTDIVGSNRTVLAEGDAPIALPFIWRGQLDDETDRLMTTADAQTIDDLGLQPEHVEAVAFSRRPKGVPAAELRPDQHEILRALLLTYVGRIDDELADAEMAKFDGDGIAQLHFLWAGGVELGEPHYYRVQGDDVLVEYDNAQRGGNHVHTVWRDLTNDFGGDPLAEHYATGHPH